MLVLNVKVSVLVLEIRDFKQATRAGTGQKGEAAPGGFWMKEGIKINKFAAKAHHPWSFQFCGSVSMNVKDTVVAPEGEEMF